MICYHRTDQQTSSNTPPPGKGDLLPPNRSRSCTAPPPGKKPICFHRADHRALIRHHWTGPVCYLRADQGTSIRHHRENQICCHREEISTCHHRETPICNENCRFPERNRLDLWRSEQLRIRANCGKEKFTMSTEIGALISLKPALMGASVL